MGSLRSMEISMEIAVVQFILLTTPKVGQDRLSCYAFYFLSFFKEKGGLLEKRIDGAKHFIKRNVFL